MKQTVKITLITIIAFALYYFSSKFYFKNIYDYLCNFISIKIISYLLTYLITGMPLFIGLFLIHKPINITKSLGINKGFLTGVIFAAFFEELYFRGVFFGQLFRYAKIGFIPSILLCALLFASGHLWQSSDLSVLVGIFATTFLGALFFAWTYIEWNNNLWVPIGLHLFMNLHWMLFSVGDNALGDAYANIFRAITIAFTIVGTLLYKKHNKAGLKITRNNLWINKNWTDPANNVNLKQEISE